MTAEWPTLALYWYAPRITGGVVDPIFGKPLNFYLFTLPAWQLVSGWLIVLAVITCAVAGFFILISGGSRALAGRRDSYLPLPWRGLSITFAFLLLILAMRVYVGRFEQLLEDHTIFAGVTYTDAHVMLPGLLVVCAALVLGAAIAAVNAVSRHACAGWLRRSVPPRSVTCPSARRLVRQQLYRQTQRTGSRAALHCAQHRADAAGLRVGPGVAARVSRGNNRRGRSTRRTIRLRCRIYGCGTGAPCRTRCARFRKSAPTTTFPISISIATKSTARFAR